MMDRRDEVCSYKNYKKSIFANLLLFFVNEEFYTEMCEDTGYLINLYILFKALLRVLYGKCSMRGHVERLIQHKANIYPEKCPKCCIFCTHKFRWCFKWYIVF